MRAEHRCPPGRVDDGSGDAPAGHHASKKSLIAQEQEGEARARWQAEIRAWDPERLIFLDETRTPTTLTLRWGRAPRGQRVPGRVPRGRWQAVTLIATLTVRGLGPGLQFAGTLDRPLFDAFVAEVLAPTLRPGDCVVRDTRSVHTSVRARQAIEAAGAYILFLPTSSPDFNPMEQAFAKRKHRLRTSQARTMATVMDATIAHSPAITAHAGYNL